MNIDAHAAFFGARRDQTQNRLYDHIDVHRDIMHQAFAGFDF